MPDYHAKKRLGQNFLVTQSIIDSIIELIAPSGADTIVEIGPGRGALTLSLGRSGAKVVAVEFDRDMMPHLQDTMGGYNNVEVLNQDFLGFEPETAGIGTFKLVGNLPYNLSSPVIDWTVAHASSVARAVFMVQKEVAERLCSSPGGKNWSPLAIFTQLHFETVKMFDVKPEHFRPVPKVTSSVVKLEPRQDVGPVPPDGFERVVRGAFRQRRKQLVNNLAVEFDKDSGEVREAIGEAGLAEKVRAEQVSIGQFFNLTRILRARRIV